MKPGEGLLNNHEDGLFCGMCVALGPEAKDFPLVLNAFLQVAVEDAAKRIDIPPEFTQFRNVLIVIAPS